MSAIILLIVGIFAVVVEIFFASFFLLFIGIGFCITALLEYFLEFERFGNPLMWQSVSICAFSLISLVLLRKPIKSWFHRSQHYKDNLFDEGVGEIREGMVYFKGTLWAYETSSQNFTPKEGDKVKVVAIKGNKAIIDAKAP